MLVEGQDYRFIPRPKIELPYLKFGTHLSFDEVHDSLPWIFRSYDVATPYQHLLRAQRQFIETAVINGGIYTLKTLENPKELKLDDLDARLAACIKYNGIYKKSALFLDHNFNYPTSSLPYTPQEAHFFVHPRLDKLLHIDSKKGGIRRLMLNGHWNAHLYMAELAQAFVDQEREKLTEVGVPKMISTNPITTIVLSELVRQSSALPINSI